MISSQVISPEAIEFTKLFASSYLLQVTLCLFNVAMENHRF